MRKTSLLLLLSAAFSTVSPVARAGRPMSTDDAGTVGHLHYQIEGWREAANNQHSTTLAPAVGLGDFEIGLEFSKTRAPEGLLMRDHALAWKWAPASLSLGPVRFAAKAWHARSRESFEGEHTSNRENGAIAVATWTLAETISAHLNLGLARNREALRTERVANLALSWAAHPRATLFAEVLHQQYAPSTQATGLRFWAVPDQFALDLTASREAGVKGSRSIGLGFGWYGDF